MFPSSAFQYTYEINTRYTYILRSRIIENPRLVCHMCTNIAQNVDRCEQTVATRSTARPYSGTIVVNFERRAKRVAAAAHGRTISG